MLTPAQKTGLRTTLVIILVLLGILALVTFLFYGWLPLTVIVGTVFVLFVIGLIAIASEPIKRWGVWLQRKEERRRVENERLRREVGFIGVEEMGVQEGVERPERVHLWRG